MAFLIETELKGYEYRGYEEGVSQKSGKTWLTLKFEDSNARQIEVSVPHDMQRDPKVANLRRGDMCDVVVRAVAGRDRSYIQLLYPPTLLNADTEGAGF